MREAARAVGCAPGSVARWHAERIDGCGTRAPEQCRAGRLPDSCLRVLAFHDVNAGSSPPGDTSMLTAGRRSLPTPDSRCSRGAHSFPPRVADAILSHRGFSLKRAANGLSKRWRYTGAPSRCRLQGAIDYGLTAAAVSCHSTSALCTIGTWIAAVARSSGQTASAMRFTYSLMPRGLRFGGQLRRCITCVASPQPPICCVPLRPAQRRLDRNRYLPRATGGYRVIRCATGAGHRRTPTVRASCTRKYSRMTDC